MNAIALAIRGLPNSGKSYVCGRGKFLSNAREPFPHQAVGKVRLKLSHQHAEAAGIVPQAEVYIPGILLLEALSKGDSFHREKGHERRHSHTRRVFASSRQNP